MKNFLLATTAIVAAAAIATPASAADKVKLSLGGFFVGAIGYVDEDLPAGASQKDIAFGQNSEVHFKGKTVLDNGLEIGFTAELELERDGNADGAGADTIDEVYIYVKSGFGKFEFGEQDGVGDQMSFTAPYITKYVHSNDSEIYFPTFRPINLRTDVGNDSEVSEDNRKINYITPRLYGFQAGVSYTPEPTKGGQGLRASAATNLQLSSSDAGAYSNTLEFGLNYAGEFNGFSIEVGGVYLTSDLERASATKIDNWKEWGVGAEFGYELPNGGGELALGGAYRDTNLSTINDGVVFKGNDSYAYDVGLKYSNGPWMVGGYYLKGKGDDARPASRTAITGTAYSAELGYQVGPGIQLAGGVQYWEYDREIAGVDTPFGDPNESLVVFLETGISF